MPHHPEVEFASSRDQNGTVKSRLDKRIMKIRLFTWQYQCGWSGAMPMAAGQGQQLESALLSASRLKTKSDYEPTDQHRDV